MQYRLLAQQSSRIGITQLSWNGSERAGRVLQAIGICSDY